MELPKHRVFVQKHMGKPLDKVQYHKEYEQLGPLGPMTDVDYGQRGTTDSHVLKKHTKEFVNSTDDYGKNEKVEKHIESIQPKVLPKNGLFFAPREKDFQSPYQQRDQDKSPKIIGVPRNIKKDGLPCPTDRTQKTIDQSFKIFQHRCI